MEEAEFGVKVEKVDGPSVPLDYIWARGPEQKALGEMVEEAVEPPSGYYKINIASETKLPGFKNMNPWLMPEGADIRSNVDEYPWPFADGTAINLNIGPLICQLKNLDDFMNEAYRILVPNGVLTIFAPYYTSSAYFSNPRNVTPITDDSLGFYNVKWVETHQVKKVMKCDFEPEGATYYYTEDWLLRSDIAKDWARKHYWNVCEAVKVTLKAVKPIREVGQFKL